VPSTLAISDRGGNYASLIELNNAWVLRALDEVKQTVREQGAATDAKLADVKQTVREQGAATDAKLAAIDGKLDAKLAATDAKLAAIDGKMDAKLTTMDAKLAAIDGKMDAKLTTMDARLQGIEKAIVEAKAEIRTTFLWAGMLFAFVEFVLANKGAVQGLLNSL
jgi:hypothetical protein